MAASIVTTSVSGFVRSLLARLEDSADPERAAKMAAYMQGHAVFLGVGAMERRRIQRAVLGSAWRRRPLGELVALSSDLWAHPWRECHYAALDVLAGVARRLDVVILDDVLIPWVGQNSWWDTVDQLAANVVGPVLAQHPQARVPRVGEWARSDDMWVQRTAVLFQLHYGADTEWPLLAQTIDAVTQGAFAREFFIRKAVGWVLRQYSAVAAEVVVGFVDGRPHLAGLSRREALRNVDPELLARLRAARVESTGREWEDNSTSKSGEFSAPV